MRAEFLQSPPGPAEQTDAMFGRRQSDVVAKNYQLLLHHGREHWHVLLERQPCHHLNYAGRLLTRARMRHRCIKDQRFCFPLSAALVVTREAITNSITPSLEITAARYVHTERRSREYSLASGQAYTARPAPWVHAPDYGHAATHPP